MIKGLSHIAIRARDLDESLRFYREVLGLEEAFRISEEDGSPRLVYVWIAPGQFLELFPNGKTDPERGGHMTGMQHICLETDDAEAEHKRLTALGVKPDGRHGQSRGAPVLDPRSGRQPHRTDGDGPGFPARPGGEAVLSGRAEGMSGRALPLGQRTDNTDRKEQTP